MRYEEINDNLRPLIIDFFFWFSRFEFALKEANLLASHKVGAAAQPGWKDFVETYFGQYQPSAAAAELIAANPQKQVVGDTGLEFTGVIFEADDSPLRHVTVLLKTVRNNLFHGGKSGGAGWDDPERIRQLLPPCITILGELAALAGIEADYTGCY